jgi:hypothetical protein
MTPKLTRTVLAFLAAVSAAGCLNDGDPIAGIPTGAANGLYPQIVISGSRATSAELRLSLLRKPEGVLLGSFQGELRFDPQALVFRAAQLPRGVEGVAALIAPGKVRFVGTALDGVGEVPLLVVQFSRIGPLRTASVEADFEDISAVDLSDLTPALHQGTPLVSIR